MSYPTYDLTLKQIFDRNVERCERWHPEGIYDWSPLEWAGAMCGEAGEAANAAKKLKRAQSKLQNKNAPGRTIINEVEAKAAIACEVADTILYGLLLLARIGCTDPEEIIAQVFNKKSVEYGFPERL